MPSSTINLRGFGSEEEKEICVSNIPSWREWTSTCDCVATVGHQHEYQFKDAELLLPANFPELGKQSRLNRWHRVHAAFKQKSRPNSSTSRLNNRRRGVINQPRNTVGSRKRI